MPNPKTVSRTSQSRMIRPIHHGLTANGSDDLIRFPESYASGAGGVSQRMEFFCGKSKSEYEKKSDLL